MAEVRSDMSSRAARRVALLQFISVATALILGMLIAVVARAAVAMGGAGIVESGLYSRAMTLHAIIMVYLGLIPGIPFALGRLLAPALLDGELHGARRTGWTSLGLYWAGAILVVASAVAGRLDCGLSYFIRCDSGHSRSMAGLTVGVLFVGLAVATNGYAFVAASRRFHTRRHDKKNLSTFAILICISVIVQSLVLPVQACTLVLMLVNRLGSALNVGRGGDPLWLRQLVWFYLQPAMLASILPVVGIISHFIERHTLQVARHNTWIVRSALVFSILGFTTWGVNLVSAGQSPLASVIFSATSLLLLVPLSVPFPIWIAQLRQVSPQHRSQLSYAVGAIVLLALGLLSMLPAAMLSVNSVLHGTQFEVGQLHFIGMAVGAMVLLGGMRGNGSDRAASEPAAK